MLWPFLKLPIATNKRLCDFLKKDQNNFDLIRLIAAILVIYGHSYGFQSDPIYKFTNGLEYSGSIAVYAFFLLSGMLITASYEKTSSVYKFLKSRFIRIYPALFVSIFVSTLIVGLFFTTIKPINNFFLNHETFLFIKQNVLMYKGIYYNLPGAFSATFTPGAINFPWWTLPVEIGCYISVLFMGILGCLKKTNRAIYSIIGLLIIFFIIAHFNHTWKFFEIVGGYSFYPVVFFLVGCALYKTSKYVIINGYALLGAVACYLILHNTVMGSVLFYPIFMYGVLWLSTYTNGPMNLCN